MDRPRLVTLRAALAFALVAVLLAPGAVAAAPISGELELTEGGAATGSLSVRAASISWNLSTMVLDGMLPALEAETGSAVVVAYEKDGIDGVVDGIGTGREGPRLDLDEGVLTRLVCGQLCRIVLMQDDAAAFELQAAGRVDLKAQPERRVACGVLCEDYERRATEGSLLLTWDDLQQPRASTSGNVTILLTDARAEFTTRNERVVVDALWWNRTAASLPIGAPFEGESRHALITLSGATFAAGPALGGDLFVERGEVHVVGLVSAERATGELQFGRDTVPVRDEAVGIEGRVTYVVSGEAAAPLGLATTTSIELAGEADRVTVAGVARGGSVLVPNEVTRPLLWGGGLAALLLALHRVGVAVLYARIPRDQVLDHPLRDGILRTLRSDAGLSVSELGQRHGASRVVVQHHLRVLEKHALVRGRRVGRFRRYVATDAMAPQDSALAIALAEDPTRRRIAMLLAQRGPLTQREISEATGIHQRLVSHHLDRLRASRLVTSDGAFPQRYAAEEGLVRLALHDRRPPVVGVT